MTGKKGSGAPSHQTTVALREDIYRQALVQGIDISDACNKALASLTGIDYHGRREEEAPAPQPVIIAKTGSVVQGLPEQKKVPLRKLHPVINADDPSAPAKVVQAKTAVKKAEPVPPAALPAPATAEEKPVIAQVPAPKKAPAKKEPAKPKKKGAGDALKQFFSSRITRSGNEEDRVKKDELYDLFTRFCRDHRITPVPERRAVTVALKNQLALTEKTVDGTPFWTGVRLK